MAVGEALANSEDAVARLRGKGEVQRGEPTFTDVMDHVNLLVSHGRRVCGRRMTVRRESWTPRRARSVASGFPQIRDENDDGLGKWRVEGVHRRIGVDMLDTNNRRHFHVAADDVGIGGRGSHGSGRRVYGSCTLRAHR